jgi:hypothetical protein
MTQLGASVFDRAQDRLASSSTGITRNPGLRAAVLRRSERTRFSSANDDEVSGYERAMREPKGSDKNAGK